MKRGGADRLLVVLFFPLRGSILSPLLARLAPRAEFFGRFAAGDQF